MRAWRLMDSQGDPVGSRLGFKTIKRELAAH
jgi:hypothetical protein